MNKGRVISSFLNSLARKIEGLSDSEVDALFEQTGLGHLFDRSSVAATSKRAAQSESKLLAEMLLQELAVQPSRAMAADFLSKAAPPRRVLIEAAKMRDLYITKQDTVSRVAEKLVENVVGSRLDSARIRGS